MTTGLQTFIKDIRKHVGEPNCILDIGSRDCAESLDFLREFPNAEIYAFEPSSKNYKLCEAAISKTKIKAINLALSNFSGEASFYYTAANIGASSLAKPYEVPWTNDQTVIVEKVKVDTLDNWCAENNVKPDVLWVDVQSQEGPLFLGAKEALKSVKLIYTEAGLVPYYENHSLRDDIVKILENEGFKLIRDDKDWEKETNLTFLKA